MEAVYVFLGEQGAAKFAWAIKAELEKGGFRRVRVVRSEWGFRVEADGLVLDVFPHPEERGVWGVELKPPRGLARLFARARQMKALDAVQRAVRAQGLG